ncbi:MAG: VOC family protein [Pseudomonas sp.]|nr:MAG: VOC family protein [Pseudomonas sp.]
MFSHVFISVTDFDRAFRLYQAVMSSLGLELGFCEHDKPWAGWDSPGHQRPFFVICKPYDGQLHNPGNGQMTAFLAASRAIVDEVHRVALASGATCECVPGLRLQYHAHYYGAYFRDPDGNKLGVACHTPVP